MKIASSLLLLIGALAVLTLGALGVSAAPAMAEAPCHEMSHETTSTDPAPNRPAKAMKAMACCVACVAAPALPPAFMHRMSAMDSPEAPITHHWLDSTHIVF
ncbi:MAG: hypothetical protein H2037_00005, partial [Brevundimonas sp.]|nr:hypothetical protein [Brevundimonas sp.]